MVAGGLPARKLIVKPNFAENPGPRPTNPSASKDILYVGRVSEEKGVTILLDAWEHSGLSPEFKLLVLGDGPQLESLVARRSQSVQFMGHVPPASVRRLMLSARALAVPSVLYENQPMVILEAMAAGLPILVSNHGWMESLADRRCGVMGLPPGDVPAWASALRRITRQGSAELVVDMGLRVRSEWSTRYAPEVALRSLESIYELVADGPAPI